MPENFVTAPMSPCRSHSLTATPCARALIPDLVNESRSFRDASRMNWVTGARGVTLEKIEFHERLAPGGVDL